MWPKQPFTAALGTIFIVLGLVILLIWIPMDTRTGIIEKVRGRTIVGDSLATSFAAVIMIVAGLLTVLESRRADGADGAEPRLTWSNLGFVLFAAVVVVAGFVLMRWVGPAAASLLGAGEYRLLRADVPWKYLGFLSGSSLIVLLFILAVERKFSWRALAVALLAPLAIALFYDLPFEDLQLPPNGDVG